MEWLAEYFEETDKVKRWEILDEVSGDSAVACRICQEIWERRYGQRQKEMEGIDYFIRSMVLVQTYRPGIINMLLKKQDKTHQELLHNLFLEDIISYGEIGRDILYQEFCQCASLFFSMCEDSKPYCSKVFGMGTMSKEEVKNKIYDEIERLKDQVSQRLKMENELSLFINAFFATYEKRYMVNEIIQ